MTARDLMLPLLWRTVASGQGVLLATLGAVAFTLGALSTIAVFEVRRRLTERFSHHPLHRSREAASHTTSAVHAERRQIAREVQEIVAHPLVVITTLADGAAVTVHQNPDVAAEAMNQAAATSRQTMQDLKRLVGRLQDESDRPPPRS